MVRRRRRTEDSQATEVTNNQRQRELLNESSAIEEERAETSDSDSTFEAETNPAIDHVDPAAVEPEIVFESFTDTPKLNDVRKELEGTKLEPLLPIAVSHPAVMKDPILKHAVKMLDLYFKLRQKLDAQSKQKGKTEDGGSYIPGSMRTVNPVATPNYLKGNQELEEIVERGRVENEARKERFAGLAMDTTKTVIDQTEHLLQDAFLDAAKHIAELLVIQYEEHASEGVTYENSNVSDYLASISVFKFIYDKMDAGEMQELLGFSARADDTARTYRLRFNCPRLRDLTNYMCETSNAVTKKVASSLGDVLEQLTVALFGWHRAKE